MKSVPKNDIDEKKTQHIVHKSVLVQEVLQYLNPQPHKTYLDATFGSGGHTKAILDYETTCTVIALDWDINSINHSAPALEAQYSGRLKVLWGNFALLHKILRKDWRNGISRSKFFRR